MIQRILAPVDGSESATRAAAFAAELAARFHASILLLHVLTRVPARLQLKQYLRTLEASPDPDAVEIESVRNVLATSGEAEGREILAEAQRHVEKAGVAEVDAVLADGDAAQEIVRQAKRGEFDIVVMGRRGLGGFQGLVMGSVSYRVLHALECPVVTMR